MLLITIIILTFVESRIIQYLIDFKTKVNFISQSLIKNVQLKKNIVIDEFVKMVDNYVIRIYNKHIVDMFIDNLHKVFKNFECEFYVININNYNIILNYL